MTKNEIRADIKSRIKKDGVKKAYQNLVLENAKVMKPQFKTMNDINSKMGFIQLAHGITVKGITEAGMVNEFNKIFYKKNVLFDNVYDEILEELMTIASRG